jgi:hypothetical protein
LLMACALRNKVSLQSVPSWRPEFDNWTGFANRQRRRQ